MHILFCLLSASDWLDVQVPCPPALLTQSVPVGIGCWTGKSTPLHSFLPRREEKRAKSTHIVPALLTQGISKCPCWNWLNAINLDRKEYTLHSFLPRKRARVRILFYLLSASDWLDVQVSQWWVRVRIGIREQRKIKRISKVILIDGKHTHSSQAMFHVPLPLSLGSVPVGIG